MKADECRWNAAVCRKEAKAAKTEGAKRDWLHLANSWDQLAENEGKEQRWLLPMNDSQRGTAPTSH
jgi:hypothetical protein